MNYCHCQHECMCGHEKDLASGAQRTEGGGDPLPIRGTFSWRGFPPNRADWFLSKQDSDVRKEKMRARVDRVRKEKGNILEIIKSVKFI